MENKKHIFSKVERNVFIDILKKFSHIVECKKTDGQSLQQKNTAWNKIASEYNASPHASHHATSKQLRRLWMNLKQRQREKLTTKHQHRLSVSGGSSMIDCVVDPNVSQLTQGLLVSVVDAIESETVSKMVEVEDISQINPPPSSNPGSSTPIISKPSIPTHHSPNLPKSNFPDFPKMDPNACYKADILQKEYNDRRRRADELHALEVELMQYKIRKAKAEADLALLIYEKHNSPF